MKPWQSKTVWFNFVGLIVAAVGIFFPNFLGVGKWITDNAPVIGVVWTVLGLGLRAVTKDKIVLVD